MLFILVFVSTNMLLIINKMYGYVAAALPELVLDGRNLCWTVGLLTYKNAIDS
jgi:hypothetical protein